MYRGKLDFPASTSEAALNSPEDSEYGDAAHCRAALYRTDASPVKKAAQNKVRASQIGRTVNVAGTSGAAPLVKEADENAVEAS